MLRILPLKYSRGRQGDWNVDPQTGDNACSALKNLLKELDDATSGEIAQARRAVLTPVLEGLREFALNYARQRRAEGRAEFHDLLAWAHELLRDNLEVRDHFRRRFSHLLIDEAQDTDPIQAEIAMFLAEYVPEGQPGNFPPHGLGADNPGKGQAVRRRRSQAVDLSLPPRRRGTDEKASTAYGGGGRAHGQPGCRTSARRSGSLPGSTDSSRHG